jgi:aminomethyltransferase
MLSAGKVTSGIPSPSLGQNIAMGYVESGQHKKDTPLQVMVRNKLREAKVVKLPFTPARYYRGL